MVPLLEPYYWQSQNLELIYPFDVFLISLCYSVIRFQLALGHGITEKANLELKQASLYHLSYHHHHPNKIDYNQNSWKKWFKLNSIVVERNSLNNWANKLSAKWWNWTKIKAWPMAKNCWIYFSEESKDATPNYYSHPWINQLVSPVFLPCCLFLPFYCSSALPPEGRLNKPKKVKITLATVELLYTCWERVMVGNWWVK